MSATITCAHKIIRPHRALKSLGVKLTKGEFDDFKGVNHREVWRVSEDHILSIIIFVTPRFFMWVGFLLAVGSLQTLNHLVNTNFTLVLYYISSGLFGAYTYVILLTIGRFFVQRGLDRVQKINHKVTRFIIFLSIVFTAMLVTLFFIEFSNQLKLVVAAIK